VLFGHRNPDGDALGATMGLCGVLKAMGKEVTVVLPNDFPDYLSWIKGVDEAMVFSKHPEDTKKVLEAADFMVMLDFNAPNRVGDLEEFIPTVPFAMIDHHPMPQFDTPMLFLDTSVSSTCEYLTKIIYEMELDNYIDKDIATALFVGILTDTGRFNHNSSNPQTYRMVANLMEKGVDKDVVIDTLYDRSTESRMRLMGFVLNEKMEVFPDHGLALISLSMEEKQRFNFQAGDAEGFVNLPLSIEGVERSVFMQEYDGMVRMSFRSKGENAINEIASEHFEGGGHRNAAGGVSYESLEKTLAKVKTIFKV
jgi:phosphoesterase RecJ-like protein